MGEAIEPLLRRERGHRLDDGFGTEAARVGNKGRGSCSIFETLNPAKAAAGWACHRPAPRGISFRARLCEPGPHLDAKGGGDDLEARDLLRPFDQPFGDGKAEAEVF